jgi:hypothetical protein
MRRANLARAIVAGTLASTFLANVQAPAAAVPLDGEGPASVIVSATVTNADGPSPHFGFSSMLNQVATPVPPPFLPPPFLPPPFLPPPPPPPLPLLPPPPLAPQMAQPPMLPEVPVIPEADSLLLLASGLVALGGLAAFRAVRRRQDDEP